MTSNVGNKTPILVAFALTIIAWLVLVSGPLLAAIEIWIGNEIYNHCLIVIPAAIFLIYEKRKQIAWSNANMSWLALIVFFGQLLFYILGTAADIQLFQHIALFSMLSTIVWIFIGNKLAWELKFPLCFVLFAVPVGEELIPFLQEITADMSVFMLELTGIPLFRSGLFIEIPQGKFLVAEACSGVSFLIASIVLGNLYAYMNLVSWKRRVFFVLLSIIFPIIANSVRVYGIIYIGYASDMEHAVGADHLIYGWFFFAFVLVCLFLIGEIIRRSEVKKHRIMQSVESHDSDNKEVILSTSSNTPAIPLAHSTKQFKLSIVVILLALLLLTKFQAQRITSSVSDPIQSVSLHLDSFSEVNHFHSVNWNPRFMGNSAERMYHLRDGQFDFDVYFAYFNGKDGELVSSLNRLYEQERWTLIDKQKRSIDGISVIEEKITTSTGIQKRVVYWYLVGDKLVTSFKDVKVQQLLQRLQGEPFQSAVIAVAIEIDSNKPLDENEFTNITLSVMRNNSAIFDE